jgi:transcriptional regulator with XRE-family HTH domain
MKTKDSNAIDKHVGNRVRMRRLMLHMSKNDLGAALGITFQQVQKYEKGMNRIGAGRLQHMAHILRIPVEYFFDGAPRFVEKFALSVSAAPPNELDEFMRTREGLDLARAFTRITNPGIQRKIVDLVEEIVGGKPTRAYSAR